ncbi:MAG TPA: hypothetical protein VIY47_16135, partial [Ignavibacteriaceae bacterium]
MNNRFALESMSISFIKSPLSEVKEEMKSIVFTSLNEKWKRNQYKLTDSSGLTSFILESDFDAVKILLWQPKSVNFDLVVFLTNMSDGWQTILNVYFNQFQREFLRVKLSDDFRDYPAYLFEYIKTSNHRIVQAMKDSDKWFFFESGVIMS